MHQFQIAFYYTAQFLKLLYRFKMSVDTLQLGVFFVPTFLIDENNNQQIVLY